MFTVMKPKLIRAIPTTDRFIYQTKYDGGSAFIQVSKNAIKIYHSKNATPVNYKYPELIPKLKEALSPGIYIAELCVITDEFPGGDFSKFQKRQCEHPFKIRRVSSKHPVTVMIYDAVEIDNIDIHMESLTERQKILQSNIKENDAVRIVESYEDPKEIIKHKDILEGIVAKEKDSTYHQGTRRYWYKIRFNHEETVRCISYEDHPKGITLITNEKNRINLPGRRSTKAKEKINKNGYVDIELIFYSKSNDGGYRFSTVKRVL